MNGIHNVKIFHYVGGTQIRIYKNAISHGDTLDVERESKRGFSDNKEKSMISSSNRSKQKLYGIARSNEWEYFLTITFDPKKIDSTNYDLISKKVTQWLNNLKKRKAHDLKYLIVPELHSDKKKYHFHALLSNIGDLSLSDSGHKYQGSIIYNLEDWKYGFSTITKIKDSGRASSYIAKYITKDLLTLTENKKRYWASRNCILPEQTMEYLCLSKVELEKFLNDIADDVNYMKTVENNYSNQIVTYIEVNEKAPGR